jgi:DNA-binding SARP family transcriptional activator
MTAAAESASKGSSGSYSGQPATSKLLEAGQYKQLTELLTKAQEASRQEQDVATAEILAAALQLCLAASQHQAEMAWHQQAYEEAHRRGEAIKGQIAALLDLVSDLEALEKRPPAGLKLPQPEKPKSGERPSRWQRLQSLLGWRPDPQDPEREAVDLAPSSAAEKTKVASPPEKIETPLSPPAEQDKLLPTPPKIDVAGTASATEEVTATPSIEETEVPSTAQETGRPPLSAAGQGEVIASSLSEGEATPVGSLVSDQQHEERPEEPDSPSLVVYCLGSFQVYQDGQPIQDWKSSKGKAIFKYLVVHHGVPIAKEVLMDLFWPGADPDAARNNLNVAIYGLRQTFRKTQRDLSHILFLDDRYLLNPELQIWVDVEEFLERFKTAQNLEQRGELTLAVREYRTAEALYQGEFLEEDRYEDWLLPQRQRLQDYYLNLLDRLSRHYLDQEDYDACATMCEKMLVVDPCREEAHRRLMRYYSQQKQRYMALRQYHLCAEALARELDVNPSQTTIALYKQIHQNQ